MARRTPEAQHTALARLGQALRAQAETRAAAESAQQRVREERAKQEAEAAPLLAAAMRDVIPLKASNRALASRPKAQPVPRHSRMDDAAVLVESLSDEFEPDTLLDIDDTLSWRRNDVAEDSLRALRRGRWVIEAELDLHGARRDEARAQLVTFLRECVQRQLRCVRIIHGKGYGSAGKLPVLKGKVRLWLMQKEEVLAFVQARPHDGGGGALLVLLKPPAR